jgi:hypothetical protein
MRFSILHLSDLHRDVADEIDTGALLDSLERVTPLTFAAEGGGDMFEVDQSWLEEPRWPTAGWAMDAAGGVQRPP